MFLEISFILSATSPRPFFIAGNLSLTLDKDCAKLLILPCASITLFATKLNIPDKFPRPFATQEIKFKTEPKPIKIGGIIAKIPPSLATKDCIPGESPSNQFPNLVAKSVNFCNVLLKFGSRTENNFKKSS